MFNSLLPNGKGITISFLAMFFFFTYVNTKKTLPSPLVCNIISCNVFFFHLCEYKKNTSKPIGVQYHFLQWVRFERIGVWSPGLVCKFEGVLYGISCPNIINWKLLHRHILYILYMFTNSLTWMQMNCHFFIREKFM
jgi:hypothetical protein